MIIELIGPSGIGKTSILNYVKNDLNGLCFLTGEQFQQGPLKTVGVKKDALRELVEQTFSNEFISGCLDIIVNSAYSGNGKLRAINIFKETIYEYAKYTRISGFLNVVHDELLSHRGMTVLARSHKLLEDSKFYYHGVPCPDGVVILTAPPDVIVQRVLEFPGSRKNVYYGLSDAKIESVVAAQLNALELAKEELDRKVPVRVISACSDLVTTALAAKNAIAEIAASDEKFVKTRQSFASMMNSLEHSEPSSEEGLMQKYKNT